VGVKQLCAFDKFFFFHILVPFIIFGGKVITGLLGLIPFKSELLQLVPDSLLGVLFAEINLHERIINFF
jgi:hypothetical protein